MADYSYITIEFPLDRLTEDLKHLTDDAATFCDRLDGEMLVTVEEARYGFPVPYTGSTGVQDYAGDPWTWELVKGLTAEGVPFRGYDAGGHEWPEQEYAWTADHGWKVRQLDGVGNPVLAAHQFAALMESGQPASRIVQDLAQHFGDDPLGWL